MAVSITDPISQAINRAKLITFGPFDLKKWFVMGFVAWLSSLGEGGGMNFQIPNFGGGARAPVPAPAPAPFPRPMPGRRAPSPPVGGDEVQQILSWINANLGVVIIIAVVAFLVLIALILLLTWLSSRGQMMFVYNVALNVAEVSVPWNRYREQANTLFLFRTVVALIWLAGVIFIAGIALLLAWGDISARTFGGGAASALIVGILLFVPFALALTLIGWCTKQFVVPIMYATGANVIPAWNEFRTSVLAGHVGSFILFLLMQIVLGIGVAIAAVAVGCVTCCIGFLPYLSAVATLPLSVFMRSYSIYFLQQFGPRYQIMVEMPAAPVAYGFPVMPPQGTQWRQQ